MAERRMFAKSVVLSDAFLDLPVRARCLYFTLGMVADDDGFINSPKSVLRQCGATAGDLKRLVEGQFLLEFDSGVVVIRHWRVHNWIPKDRYRETSCQAEMAQLGTDENKVYTFQLSTECIQNVDNLYTQDRLGQDSLGQSSKDQFNLIQFNLNQERIDSRCETQSEKIAHWRAQLQRLEG